MGGDLEMPISRYTIGKTFGKLKNKGLTKARCVRKQKAKGKSLTSARRACNVKGTYKGERRRTGKRAFE